MRKRAKAELVWALAIIPWFALCGVSLFLRLPDWLFVAAFLAVMLVGATVVIPLTWRRRR